MEAANLGARLAEQDSGVLDQVLAEIAARAAFHPTSRPGHASRSPRSTGSATRAASLGIPTWHYGHEPPNAFSSAVAKYFRNAIREDVLLEVCRGGIVFLPGAAGTVQEIFQAACTNYYAAEAEVVPMVFVGGDYWTATLPAWPLVDALAAGRPFGARATSRRRPRQEALAPARGGMTTPAGQVAVLADLGVLVRGPAQRPGLELAVAASPTYAAAGAA